MSDGSADITFSEVRMVQASLSFSSFPALPGVFLYGDRKWDDWSGLPAPPSFAKV